MANRLLGADGEVAWPRECFREEYGHLAGYLAGPVAEGEAFRRRRVLVDWEAAS